MQERNNANIEWPAHTHSHTNLIWTCNASHLLRAIRLSLGKSEAKNKCDQTKNRFHHFSSFTFLPSSTYNFISVWFLLGMRFTLQVLAHIQHASSYGVRCSVFRTPTSRAHIGRRKRLLCITAASSSSAYDAICAVHFGCVLFSVVVVVSFWFFHLALDPKQSIKKKTK